MIRNASVMMHVLGEVIGTPSAVISFTTDNSEYDLGDIITTLATVTNDGDTQLTNVVVSSVALNHTWNVGTLNPGSSYTINTYNTYTVTEADILHGGRNYDLSVSSTELDDPIEDYYGYTIASPNPSLDVSFAQDNTVYDIGDTITPTITVTNNGNLTISSIYVDSALSGLSTTISTLSPGNSYVISESGSYDVDESNILAGSVSYDLNVSGSSSDPDYSDVIETETKSYSVVAVRKGLSINFTQDDTHYVVGDDIVPTFTITNTGNVTLSNIDISCDETGDEWLKDRLAPNITSTLYTCGNYAATSSDISNGFTCTVSCEDDSGYSTEQSYTYSVGT